MRKHAIVLAVALVLSAAAFADEITLKSGVVLDGKATPQGEDYRVDLTTGGSMTIPRALVEDIRRDGQSVTPAPSPAPSVPAPMASPRPVPRPPQPVRRTWSLPASPPPPPVPVRRVYYERQGLRPPAPCPAPCPPPPCDPCPDPCEDPCEPCKGKLDPWSISLGLSYTQAGGNSDSLSFKLDFEITLDKDPWRWTTSGFYAYAETGGIADTNRFFIESKLERKITERAYLFLLGSYDTDDAADLEHRIIGTVGGGYTFIKREKLEFRGELGGGVTAEKRVDLPEEVDPSLYLGLDYDHEFSWGGRVVIDYDFLPNLNDWDLTLMRFDGKFEVPLSSCLNFRFGLRLDYQFQPRDPTVEKLDWIVSAGLSVNF